jgi:UDP:flavonoid glycosyltransferase YjiC (YdhE family)
MKGIMTRIAVIASGSRGDVEPYLALSSGLQGAGFEVRLATHENFRSLVEQNGLELWPLEGNVQDIAQDMAVLLERGNFLSILVRMAREAKEGAIRLGKGTLAACRDSDLVIAGIGGLFPAIAAAEKYHLPLIQAYYIPFTTTKAYPSFLFPKAPSWTGESLNRLSYTLSRQMMWQAFRPADELSRRNIFEIPKASLTGPFHSDCLQGTPVLYGFSPHVIPPAPDWDQSIHVTGYWFQQTDEDWAAPVKLLEFLEAGPAPVYIGFGSMSSRKPEETGRLVLEAVRRANQRAVVLSGWGGLKATDLPKTVMEVEEIPFAWLFPRMAAVVHHGGAGTTSLGLMAGVPSVIIPFFGDQHYWAQRVFDLGVGPVPIVRKKLTADRLTQAIEQCIQDQEMRASAARLGEQIRAEDGVGRAVDVISRFVAGVSGTGTG